MIGTIWNFVKANCQSGVCNFEVLKQKFEWNWIQSYAKFGIAQQQKAAALFDGYRATSSRWSVGQGQISVGVRFDLVYGKVFETRQRTSKFSLKESFSVAAKICHLEMLFAELDLTLRNLMEILTLIS